MVPAGSQALLLTVEKKVKHLDALETARLQQVSTEAVGEWTNHINQGDEVGIAYSDGMTVAPFCF